jgi:hypothetical protein
VVDLGTAVGDLTSPSQQRWGRTVGAVEYEYEHEHEYVRGARHEPLANGRAVPHRSDSEREADGAAMRAFPSNRHD